jgi:hypothetical protein
MSIYKNVSSIQNVCLQKDFLYKEIRSILTIANPNIKIA